MKTLRFIVLLAFGVAVFSCGDPVDPETEPTNINVAITGFAQKGPFTIGTKVTVTELSSTLTETGRTFGSSIADDKGSFTVAGNTIAQPIAAISADGFYFDEVSGAVSNARIILNALVDASDTKTLNINILTHLTFERVKFLIKGGKSFKDAKAQAEKEILAIFKITDAVANFESLDIAKDGDSHAVLLAISVILQGAQSVGEVSELLAKISLDIKEDGKLDSDALKSQLINEAVALNLEKIRANITKRFQDVGQSATIGNFEKYINLFKSNSGFTITRKITYPKLTANGLNILAMNDTTVATGESFAFAANLEKGNTLKIVIKDTPTESFGSYAFNSNTNSNWKISPYTNRTQTFEATTSAEVKLMYSPGSSVIEIYENGATQPTRTIKITGKNNPTITTDSLGKFGKNILVQPYSVDYPIGNYSVQLRLNDVKERTISIEFVYSKIDKITFTDAEGWKVDKEETAGSNIVKTILSLKATKASADIKVNIEGKGTATANFYLDGKFVNSLNKKMGW